MSSKTDTPLPTPWLVAMGLTLVVAAALRTIGLDAGLWYDEIVTLVLSVRLPLSSILTDFYGVNAHPLYSVLAHSAVAIFGESAWTLRLPAYLFGIASIWMVFRLGSQLTGRIEAWAGAVVLATSYHHIWFSQNARGYTMLGFFTLMSTYHLIRARSSHRTRDYVLYALAIAAGTYTHATMVLVVAGQAVVVLTEWSLNRHSPRPWTMKPLLLAWTGAGLLTAVAYAPFVTGIVAHLGADAPREAATVATGGWAIAEALRLLISGSGAAAVLVGGLVVGAGALSLSKRSSSEVALLVMPAVLTAAGLLALGQPIRPRFFFFLSGAAAVFAGRGIAVWVNAMTRRPWSSEAPTAGIIAGACLIVGVSAIALPRNYQVPKQDFVGAVHALETEEAAGAVVSAAGPACLPLSIYFNKNTWPCLMTPDDLERLEATASPVRVLYTLPNHIVDPDLRRRVLDSCAIVRTFPGTLGDGDMVICDPRRKNIP